MSYTLVIRCDSCGDRYPSTSGELYRARAQAETAGWGLRGSYPHRKDVCPTCLPRAPK